MEVIGDYYASLRAGSDTSALPITVRTLETIIRLFHRRRQGPPVQGCVLLPATSNLRTPACDHRVITLQGLVHACDRCFTPARQQISSSKAIAGARSLYVTNELPRRRSGCGHWWHCPYNITSSERFPKALRRSLPPGVEPVDVDVAKELLDAIMAGNAEGAPAAEEGDGEDEQEADPAAGTRSVAAAVSCSCLLPGARVPAHALAKQPRALAPGRCRLSPHSSGPIA